MFVSKRKKIYRYGLLAFLVLDLVVLGILAWSRLQSRIKYGPMSEERNC